MRTEKNEWGLAEWQAYALALEKEHNNVLDGWGVTVGELEAHAKLVAELHDSNKQLRHQLALLQDTIALLPIKPSKKPRRGRPKKHGDMNWAVWYEQECLPKFQAMNKGPSPGMQKVLTWHFQQWFNELGQGQYKAHSKEFQGKLKTLVNLISDQRNPRRAV